MLLIPIETPNHADDVVIIVLGPDSLERMRQADPAEVELRKVGKKLVNPTVSVCFEEDLASLNRFIQRGDIQGLLKHLQRGWAYQPDKGDHDRGPESIKDAN